MTIMSLQQELADARSLQGQHNENLRNNYELEIRTLQERCERLETEREAVQRADVNFLPFALSTCQTLKCDFHRIIHKCLNNYVPIWKPF